VAVANIIFLMNKKSFVHQIIWIPNYVVKPKGISQWLAMFYNIFLVIAIYRLSSAADNFIQLLGVVAFVFGIFNILPFQIFLIFRFFIRRLTNKSEQKVKAPIGLYFFLIIIFLLLLIVLDANFNDGRIMDLWICRGSPPVSSGCYD